jgi:hypothetical protein
MLPRLSLTKTEIDQFVTQSLYPITSENNTRRCIDGRYIPSPNLPAFAAPGGSAGYFMTTYAALRKLGCRISSDDIKGVIIQTAGGISKAGLHTDEHDHAEYFGTCAGCGHFVSAFKKPEDYGLTVEDVKLISFDLGSLTWSGAREVVLEGNHAEKAIIILNSENYSLYNQATINGKFVEVFVLQNTYHTHRLHDIARQLASIAPQIDFDTFKNTLESVSVLQAEQTLSRIAKGLPVFMANVPSDKTHTEIQFLGTV